MRCVERRGKNRASAFTLIELLVVIGIMAILMLVGLPAFQGLNRGSKLRTSTFQLQTTLNLARQAAITQRRFVSLIFPAYTSESNMNFQAYAPYTEQDGYLREWTILPNGIIFHPTNNPIASGVGKNFFTQERSVSPTGLYTNEVPFPTATNVLRNVFVLNFRPDGAIDGPGSGRIAFFLAEGVIVSNQPLVRPSSVLYSVEANGLTGQIRTREYQL